MGQEPPGDYLAQKRMGRRFPFPLLPPLQEGARASSVKLTPPLSRKSKPACLSTRLLTRGENEAVRHAGAQILHQVQSQGVPAGAVPVEKAHVESSPTLSSAEAQSWA